MAFPGYYDNYIQGTVTLGIWAKKAGAWQLVGYDYVQIYEYTGSGGGQRTVNWYFNGSYDLGPGVQAFGVTVEGFDGIGATVDDLQSVSWSSQASSGERSATPNGQLSTVIVVPR